VTTCRAQYRPPGGHQRGDRIVDCHLPNGHPGEHEEADTETTWTDLPTALGEIGAELTQAEADAFTAGADPENYGRGYAAGLAAGLDELVRRAQRDTEGQPEAWAFVAWLIEESRKIKESSDRG
jgi:hypothetical protein